jgi:UDP-N-acetyl-2-amino-2-deoxyglucuronate dehydrogenase
MIMPKKFALIGAAGYVAPRHMKAIRETDHLLVAAVDPCDSVGVIDSYFPEAAFFVEFERFDRHLEKLRRKDQGIDYISICSPNYLHDAHIRFALRYGANAICEKPLVLNPWNIDALQEIELETGRSVHTILQLRLHPNVIALRQQVLSGDSEKQYDVVLTYITSRGNWYHISWKGDERKSGGIATNIGVHFFDMLQWIFGQPIQNHVHLYTYESAAGYLELEHARVRWFMSINAGYLPSHVRSNGVGTYRALEIEGMEFDFSKGFDDLHTTSYRHILNGSGFTMEDARNAIQITYAIRQSEELSDAGERHPIIESQRTPKKIRRDIGW